MKDYNLSAVARGDEVDFVTTDHGCTPITTTAECSDDVLINGTGVVRKLDACYTHQYPVGDKCPEHTVLAGSGSPTVFANDNGTQALTISTMGDSYGGTHIITIYRNEEGTALNCSPNVFIMPGDHL